MNFICYLPIVIIDSVNSYVIIIMIPNTKDFFEKTRKPKPLSK